MKFQITMKDPDGVYESVQDAAKESARTIGGIDDDERAEFEDIRREKIDEVIRQWFKYGEYLTVEIDTDAKTATVIEAK